jgi:transaldolase
MHWSEFIGGDVVISPPHKWQVRYNSSDVEVIPRIDEPVDPKIVEELLKKFVEFRRAYEEDGMREEEFDSYGATVRTLRGFSQGCQQLSALIRDFMLPNPDV